MTRENWIGKHCAAGNEISVMSNLKTRVTFAAGTTGAIASKELFTVTGTVLACVIPVCTTDLTGSGSIKLGISGATDAYIGSTTGTDIDDGDIWLGTTPAAYFSESDTVPQYLWINGSDIGYQITGATLTAGVIDFYLYWVAISDGAVIEGAAVNAAL